MESGDVDGGLKCNMQIQYLSAHNAPVSCLCKIDDDRFASADTDGLILIWSTENGLLMDVLSGHSASISALLVTEYKSLRLLISASLDHTVRVCDITDCSKQIECITIMTEGSQSTMRRLLK